MTDLSSVLTTVDKANGLPNAHYISDEMFALEREQVLFANWSGIGFAHEVPEIGDVNPITFLGAPLLAVRDRDGEVRVYQNTCRHRGMILVEKKANIQGVIRCPYHSWCYDLDGALKATPHVGGPGQNTAEGVDRSKLGLVEIASHVWRDVIFVNISGTAVPFEEAAADVIKRWSDFEDQPIYHSGSDSSFAFDVACNWKLAVENYCESYHLPWVHPGLNSYSRLEDHYHIEQPGKFSGQGTLVYRQLKGEEGQVFPDFEGLPKKWDTGAEYLGLFPNVLFGAQRDHCYAILLEPVAKDRTLEHVAIYYSNKETTGEGWAALRQANRNQWYGVFEEDVFVVEGMQKGRLAPFFDGGRFSPAMDGPTHCFHHWVASQLHVPAAAAE